MPSHFSLEYFLRCFHFFTQQINTDYQYRMWRFMQILKENYGILCTIINEF